MMIVRIVWGLLAALWAFDALRLRGRARSLKLLAPSDDEPSPDYRFITRGGREIDPAVVRSACAFARAEGLEVVDLIPRDLPAPLAFFLLQGVDFPGFREHRLAKTFSAGEAILLRAELHDRLGLSEPPADAVAFSKLLQRLKQMAPVTTGYAVAPGLRASGGRVPMRALTVLAFGTFAIPIVYLQILLALVGPFLAPITGPLALLAMHLQSAVATLGTALRPRGLAAHVVFRTLGDAVRMLTSAKPEERREDAGKRRETYAKLLEHGTNDFFEARREDCPFCSGKNLHPFLCTGDLFQRKPGRFTLERCHDCGHIFQNPRLSIAGLEFYYRDFYDGLGEAGLEALFSSTREPYLARARSVREAGATHPSRWLDVGTGHGHFCNVARDVYPDTVFEAVDLSSSLEEAERRGWIARGYRSLFPSIAAELAANPYDVVSMSHYLEHTREQRAEIDAARQVLRTGGYLMIEVPDPESRFGRIFGRFWLPWFHPQHQHFLSTARLEKLLRENGFEPVVWSRAEAHQRVDLLFATALLVRLLAPPLGVPWRGRPGFASRVWNKLVWVFAVPFLLLARMTDMLIAPLVRRPGWSNTFRVVAQRKA